MAVTRTANTIHMTASSDSVAMQLNIVGILWAGCTTAAHICEIKDKGGTGNILFKATGTGNGASVSIVPCKIMTDPLGVSITDLDSGYVTLYVE